MLLMMMRMCACMYACRHVCMSEYLRDQNKALDSLGMELELIVSILMWALGTMLEFPESSKYS